MSPKMIVPWVLSETPSNIVMYRAVSVHSWHLLQVGSPPNPKLYRCLILFNHNSSQVLLSNVPEIRSSTCTCLSPVMDFNVLGVFYSFSPLNSSFSSTMDSASTFRSYKWSFGPVLSTSQQFRCLLFLFCPGTNISHTLQCSAGSSKLILS